MCVLGETNDALKEAMPDLHVVDVDIVTLGHYLQVTVFPFSLTTFRGYLCKEMGV